MKKLFTILSSLPFLLTLASSNTSRTGLITIAYTGDVTKPHPFTILYLPGTEIRNTFDFIDSAWFFVYQSQITESEFDSVTKIIESKRFESKIDTLSGSIIFTIMNNDEKKVYETQDQFLIKEILNKIITQINSPEKDKKVKYPLENLMKGIGIS